jgi:hypothetical protein
MADKEDANPAGVESIPALGEAIPPLCPAPMQRLTLVFWTPRLYSPYTEDENYNPPIPYPKSMDQISRRNEEVVTGLFMARRARPGGRALSFLSVAPKSLNSLRHRWRGKDFVRAVTEYYRAHLSHSRDRL